MARVDRRRFADLVAQRPDPAALRGADLDQLIAHRAIPWRRYGGTVAIAAADPDAFEPQIWAKLLGVSARSVVLLQAAPSAVDQAILDAFPADCAARAATSAAPAHSARSGLAGWQKTVLAALAAGGPVAAALWPAEAAMAAFLALVLVVAATSLLRIAILFAACRRAPAPAPSPLFPAAAPRITLIAALRREAAAAPTLIDALSQLRYPPERLQVLLVVERDDPETKATLDALAPDWFELLVAPPGAPRTKPRALNIALPFARGEIVGVYDAEDRPEPDQLRRVAAAFAASPPEVACVQARLAYYNARDSWLTRCFAIEYASWFDLLLRGLSALRLPLPLGGTSVFFRADALRAVGAWDAHNVAEDCDLGMRLAMAGQRTALVESTTYEEATCRPAAWVRQRSRWIKGYMQTWLVLTRRPSAVLRGLGPWGALGAQILLLGSVISYLGQPLFWAEISHRIWTGQGLLLAGAPAALVYGFAGVFALGQLAMLATAVVALERRGMRWLMPWALSLPLYWPLGAIAAYKALIELLVAPSYWDKTRHAVSRVGQAERVAALARLSHRRPRGDD